MGQPLEVSDPADGGKVDWSSAEKYMRGQVAESEAADAGSEEQQSPETAREFRYRGKTVTVNPDTYSLLEDLKNEARGTNGRLGSELARTRERLAKLEGAVSAQVSQRPTEELSPPDPLLATRDIVAWQAQYDAYHAARTARQMKELEDKHFTFVREVQERTARAQSENEWAAGFYRSFDHLDHPEIKPIVAQAYTEHKEEIDGLDAESAYERLAELADQRLVRLREAGKSAQPQPNNPRRPPRIESSAGQTPRSRVAEAPREFSSSSWVARQRLKMSGREPVKGR